MMDDMDLGFRKMDISWMTFIMKMKFVMFQGP